MAMKNAMPRLIDDKRRKSSWICAFVIAVAATAVYFAYYVCMLHYNAQRERLANIINETEAKVGKLRTDVASGAAKRLNEFLNGVGGMEAFRVDSRELQPLDIDPTIFVPEEQGKAEQLRNESVEVALLWEKSTNELSIATNMVEIAIARVRQVLAETKGESAETAASNLEQCIGELKALKAQPMPSATAIAEAMNRFNRSYSAFARAQITLSEWSDTADAAISNAAKAVDTGKMAAKEVTGHIEKMSSLQNDFKALHVDRLRFADALFKKARLARGNVDSVFDSVRRKGQSTKTNLAEARKSIDAMAGTMRSLLQDNGEYVPLEPRQSFVAEARKLGEAEDQFRTVIAPWDDASMNKTAKALYAIAEQVESYAKDLSVGVASWDPNRPEVTVSMDGTAVLKEDADTVISTLEDLSERANVIVREGEKYLAATKGGLPPWGAKTVAFNEERHRLSKRMVDIVAVINEALNRLIAYRTDGNARETIRQALVSAQNDLKKAIGGKDFPLAANGREFNQQFQEQQSYVKSANTAIDNGKKAMEQFNKAVTNGTLYKIVYRHGAEVWSRRTYDGIAQKGGVVSTGGKSELKLDDAIAMADLPPYHPIENLSWKFALKIPDDGEHDLQITPRTDSTALINESAKGMGKGRSRNGKVEMSYTLRSSNRAFDTHSSFSFENGQMLVGRKSLSFKGFTTAGWVEIEFTIDSITLSDVKSHAPEEDGSWNYNPITFTITLDGAEVELYHAVRAR